MKYGKLEKNKMETSINYTGIDLIMKFQNKQERLDLTTDSFF